LIFNCAPTAGPIQSHKTRTTRTRFLMNSKSAQTLAFVVIAVLIGIYCGIAVLLNPTGGIAGVSKLITFVCIVSAFISPKKGLFVVAAQAIYTDELKRVGVYYGAMSMETVQEILIGPLLSLCALNAGFLVQFMFGRVKLNKLALALFAIAPLLALYYLGGGAIGGGDSFTKRLYNAGTAGLYTTVIPIAYCLFKDFKDWVSYLTFQTLLVVPSALWGIQQYFNGFNAMEWSYAIAGFSPVHSSQMLQFANPRVFGFFGSASAYGCLCVYLAFACWRTWRIREHRIWFFLISLILFAALVVSTQRSALLSPFIFGVAAFCVWSRLRTLALYGALAVTFLVGVWQSTWLLDQGLDKINAAIATDTSWGNEVLKVSTFSERLRGWERLKRPETWSLFGTGERSSGFEGPGLYTSDYSHDMINRVLIKVGAVGLGMVILSGGLLALYLHRQVWRLPKGLERSAASLSLGLTTMIILMSAAGGDNLTATPFNLAIWSTFAGVFVIAGHRRTDTLGLPDETATLNQSNPLGREPGYAPNPRSALQ
jgi:hypothetical protein